LPVMAQVGVAGESMVEEDGGGWGRRRRRFVLGQEVVKNGFSGVTRCGMVGGI
jgi:hypothetical protein